MKPFALVILLLLVGDPAMAAPWQPFTALASSADGRFLATGGSGGEVLCWEVSTGEVLYRWQLSGLPVAGLAFTPEGLSLAAVLTSGRASFLQGTAEPQDLVLAGSSWAGLSEAADRWKTSGSPLSGTEASWAGSVARGRPDGTVSVTGPSSGEIVWAAHGSAVTGLAWSPDGRVLTSCSSDGSLARWDPRTGKLLSRL